MPVAVAGEHEDRIIERAASVSYLTARLECLLEDVGRVVEYRQGGKDAAPVPYLGLVVTYEQAQEMLGTARDVPAVAPDIVARRRLLDRQAEEAVQAGVTPRLLALADRFGLDEVDIEILVAALAPDVDTRFERLYGFLNDDVSRRRPSIGLTFELSRIPWTDASARARFGRRGPLVRFKLITVGDEERPFLGRAISVPEPVTAYLLGDDTPDPGLLDAEVEAVGDGRSHPELTRYLGGAGGLVYFRDSDGSSGAASAISAVEASGARPVVVDLGRVVRPEEAAAVAAVAEREVRLRGGAVVASPVEALAAHGFAAVRAFADLSCPVVLAGKQGWNPEWSGRPPLILDATPLEAEERRRHWRDALGDAAVGWDPSEATAQFRLQPEQIRRAAATAAVAADYRSEPLTPETLGAGARWQNSAGLERSARRITPTVSWADLVLPEVPRAALVDLTNRARTRETVIGEWSMRPGAGRGRGITALFAGDSGTGKTLAAEVIAQSLNLDLYVVNLAGVVDKYIGETEKNLERIFTEADGINGILLFDEADALFGKRSEVQDAHDRYANIEVAYLLQRMESFDGIALLSTNLRANLDDAFARRLDALIYFPMPDEECRLILWDRCLGSDAPRADDIDLGFCAKAFELSGGNIRSITLGAAYRAAGRGEAITMEDLVRATLDEYRKLGRLPNPSEFGPYFDLVMDA